MKTARKVLAMVLAVMLLAAMMVVPAGAATGAYQVTINGTSANHTYEAYQVFAGTVSVDANSNLILSSIEWGDGVNTTIAVDGKTLLQAVAAISYDDGTTVTTPFVSCTTAQMVADELAKYSNNGAIANLFAAVVGKYLSTPSGALTRSDTTYTIGSLAAGYYLIRDVNSSVPDAANQLYTKYLITVVGNSTVTVKGSYPTVTKTVHSSPTGTFKACEDASIGDTVYFKLSGSLPSNFGDYSQYYYQFTDTLPAGLTFENYDYDTSTPETEQVHVYILHSDDSEVTIPTSAYTAVYNSGDNVLTVTIENLKALGLDVHTDDYIVVKYSAKLDADAVIGKGTGGSGNQNSVKVTYSNDPNAANNAHKGYTTASTASVYTYQLDVTKVDSSNTATTLANAEFYLYKTSTSGTVYAKVTGGKLESWGAKADATKMVTDASGKISIAGLDAGTYYLEEDKAPDGYNKLVAPVQVTIAAAYSGAEMTTLTVEVGDSAAVAGDLTTGVVGISVENKSGTTLPSTGGIGTTIFYALGAAFVLAAITILMYKKRTDAK